MTPAATRHLREIERLWASYGPALRARAALDGGMVWKSVNGAEYLCRYRQNHDTGKKQFTSLGRRSPETEAIYRDFMERRDTARHVVLSGRDQMTIAGRVAKAYGLARLPAKTAEMLRAFWLRSIDGLTIFGGVALLAYEIETETLAPADLIKDDALIVIPMTAELAIADLAEAYEAATGEKPRVQRHGDRQVLHRGDAVPVEVWSRNFVLGHADDRDQAEGIEEGFEVPLLKGLTVARDARPVEFGTFDPRVYAMLAYVLGRDRPVWAKRARFAAALVRERWPDQFEPRQESAFPDLCVETEGDARIHGP